jgi:glucokinase
MSTRRRGWSARRRPKRAGLGRPGTGGPPAGGGYNVRMILAGDVGGSKTLLGLFEPPPAGARRPRRVHVRSYATLDFTGLPAMIARFADETGGASLTGAAFGVAGPVLDRAASLTNVSWRVSAVELEAALGAGVTLLNDLEAMATAVPLLLPDELRALQTGAARPGGNIALIAAGTGLGEAALHVVNGRYVPLASEGGHADLTVRTDREIALLRALRDEFGRASVEHVVCGPGLVHVARFTHGEGRCATAGEFATAADGAARVSEAGMAGTCPACAEAVQLFVEAYGAEAGNLGLRVVATGGVFVGGGIAPKMLAALNDGRFIRTFRAKAPMDDLLAEMPVHVITNAEAALVGAAVAAADRLAAE